MSTQYAFYFDQSRCMACNACSVTCKDWNQVNPGIATWRKQHTHERGGNFFPLSMACNHCEKPACQAACHAGAIKKLDNGIVAVDRNRCMDLKLCLTACPYAVPQFADDRQEPETRTNWIVRHPMQKCNMCMDRVESGDKPTCVKACIGRAMDFGTVEYITSTYPNAVRMNKSDFPYAYENNAAGDNTVPSFFITKRATMKVHKSDNYNGKPIA